MTADSYVGRIEDFHRRVHPDERERVMEAAKDAMESKKPYEAEFRILWPDGTIRWVTAKGKFYYSPDGEPERMLGNIGSAHVRTPVTDPLRMPASALR